METLVGQNQTLVVITILLHRKKKRLYLNCVAMLTRSQTIIIIVGHSNYSEAAIADISGYAEQALTTVPLTDTVQTTVGHS